MACTFLSLRLCSAIDLQFSSMSQTGSFRPRVPSAVRKHARRGLAKNLRSSSTAAGESLREQQVGHTVYKNSVYNGSSEDPCALVKRSCGYRRPKTLEGVDYKESFSVCTTLHGAKNNGLLMKR